MKYLVIVTREVEVDADDPEEAEEIGVDLADRQAVVDVSVQPLDEARLRAIRAGS